MPRSKLDFSSVKSLVEAVSTDQDAASALGLLVADYFSAKSKLVESSKETERLCVQLSAEDVLRKISQDIAWSLTALRSITEKDGELPVNLLAAQMELRHAKASVDEALHVCTISLASSKQFEDQDCGSPMRERQQDSEERVAPVPLPETV